MTAEFEAQLLEEEAKKQSQKKDQKQKNQKQDPSSGQDKSKEQEPGEGGGDGGGDAQDGDPSGDSQEAQQQGEGDGGEQGDIQMELKDMEGGASMTQQAGGEDALPPDDDTDVSTGYAEKLAEEMLKKFEEKWAPAMEALETASEAFENLEDLITEGTEGFDSSTSVWHQTGWREVSALRKKLEQLRELRELVRSLGRGGGKGPLRRAPQQLFRSGNPPGVIRSEQSPEETRGLTRSGDLSRMLPMEAHLLAAGWPRRVKNGSGRSNGGSFGGQGGETLLRLEEEDQEIEGSRACRLLFMARRAERQLMSYERTGWLEDEPTRVTDRLELRPAAELGPIIVCLDTSGSMHGAREVVAKALTLECMRGAHRQQRKCYVYAFSGPGDVMELELGTDPASMRRLLSFLTMSFAGGTDVDAPLALSLQLLNKEGWEMADILMVTDGEIADPDEDIMRGLRVARETLGLEVHGLLVGSQVTEPMEKLCTHLHVFKSWSAV